MPYRAMLWTVVSVTVALLAVGLWLRGVAPIIQGVRADTQPSREHPVYVEAPTTNSAHEAPAHVMMKNLVNGVLGLAFILTCVLLVVGFFATLREWMRNRGAEKPRQKGKSNYVDAWKIAGER